MLDLSATDPLLPIGSVILPGTVNDLTFDEGRLLVSTTNGAVVWQVSGAGVFSIVREFSAGRGAVHLNGEVAWMGGSSSWNGRLLRYDLQATAPNDGLLSESIFYGYPWRFVEHEGIIWMAELGDHWTGSILPCAQALSPPASPVPEPLGTYAWPAGTGSWSGHEVLARIDDLVFNVSGWFEVQAADVSDPSNIVEMGEWYMPELMEVLGSVGDVLITHHDDFFDTGRNWLEFWRVQQGPPVTLNKISEAELAPLATFRGQGNKVLGFKQRDGMYLVDISLAESPVVHGPFAAWENVSDMSVSGDKALMAEGSIASLLDLTDPAAPVLLGQWTNTAGSISNCALDGETGVVASYVTPTQSDVIVLNCGTGGDPDVVSEIAANSTTVRLQDRLMFDIGLTRTGVYDLGSPANPVPLGNFWGRFSRIRRDGQLLLGLDGNNGQALTIYLLPCGTVSAAPPETEFSADHREQTTIAVAPNPANPRTMIFFNLPTREIGSLCIYDPRGRLVRHLHSGEFSAGSQSFAWDGRDNAGMTAASGLYFVRFKTDGYNAVGKLVLVR